MSEKCVTRVDLPNLAASERFGHPIDRFWQRVNKTETCWLWTAASPSSPYGRMRVGNRCISPHRFSYFIHFGSMPSGLVLHKCDVMACVNPDHLFVGTQADNMADKKSKNRQVRGSDAARSRLRSDQVLAIRAATGSQRGIARRFGVTQSAVWNIKNGRSWAWLKNETFPPTGLAESPP